MAIISLATRLLGTLDVSSKRDFSEEITKILDNANTKTIYYPSKDSATSRTTQSDI